MLEIKPRDRVLQIFRERRSDRLACFSGMGNVTVAGFEQYGYRFAELHGDPRKMAEAAASSYRMYGFECAVVPFDLCVEAEALGCIMNPYTDVQHLLYPTIKEKIIDSTEEALGSFNPPSGLLDRGRVPVVQEAIRILKREVGEEIAIGSYVLGPFTLAGQLMDLDFLLKYSFKNPQLINQLLDKLADVVIAVARAYQEAGADYITVREMGAPTDVLSPRSFRTVILPHLQKVFHSLEGPKVLHICGNTNPIVGLMAQSGADAISVEQKNDLLKTRSEVGPDVLVFGNVAGYDVLAAGSPEAVREATLRAIEGSVDSVWPSCDIWPTAPPENIRAMVDTVKEFGASKWHRLMQ